MGLVKQVGITDYPEDFVKIISQDETSVTVELVQTYTDPDKVIDNIFYQYQVDHFDTKCYEKEDVAGDDSVVEITIQCMVNSKVAILEFWVADDITKGVLSDGDNAVIPNCCNPDNVPEEKPVTKYTLEVKCVSECPDEIA